MTFCRSRAVRRDGGRCCLKRARTRLILERREARVYITGRAKLGSPADPDTFALKAAKSEYEKLQE